MMRAVRIEIPWAWVVPAVLWSALAGPALADDLRRVALVVGNGAYEHARELRNPGNDATDMAAALKALDFEVVQGMDVGRDGFFDKLDEFTEAAAGADVALFFYAGHGLQVDGRNYLAPVDARLEKELDLQREAIDLATILGEMRSPTNLVFLDACRNNPLAENLARSMGRSRSVGATRGLARVGDRSGTLIAYATAANAVADDGEGENSPFTAALLEHIGTPGLSIFQMVNQVALSVSASTGGRQEPWSHHSALPNSFPLLPKRPDGFEVSEVGSGGAEERSPSAGETNLRLTREELRGIQRALAQAGYDPGPADGIIGRGTRGAIGRWQRAQGRSATEYLGPEDAKALLALAPGPDPALAVPLPPTPPLSPPTDPSQVVLASGRLLSDWVLLSEDRLASGEYRTLLVEGAGHLREHGRFASVESVVERALEELVEGLRVTDEASARAALRSVEQIRDVAGERAALAQVEARASLRLGRFDEAVGAYRKWLRLAGPGHPERREMLAGLQKAEKRERLPQAGERFRDCDGTWCPQMVVVPAGEYRMGSPSGEAGRDDDEGPRHQVRIAKPFAVGVYEVTFSEWEACVSDGGCGHRGNDEGTHPVINVSWGDAKAYVRWLSNETGEAYRLLSESEWEYVARAGTQTRYGWGDEVGSGRANCRGCGSRRDYRQTAPVGQFEANRFGLHDVHGNVWEWVEDCWNGSYAGAPADGSAWRSGNCDRRVLRGGSWVSGPWFLRAANRSRNVTGGRNVYIGFRIARTLD